MVTISTDNVDSLVAWAEKMDFTIPMGGDFWPHGLVALDYDVMRGEGIPDRGVFLIDKEGIIRFKAVYAENEIPPVEPVMAALRELAGK